MLEIDVILGGLLNIDGRRGGRGSNILKKMMTSFMNFAFIIHSFEAFFSDWPNTTQNAVRCLFCERSRNKSAHFALKTNVCIRKC